ncbi:hypothetical protein ACOSP7_012482 [Xanthoceras sorbifolium]
MAACSKPRILGVSPLLAEAIAVLQGIQLAAETGLLPLVVETDALVVVNHIANETPPHSDVGVVIVDILRAIKDFRVQSVKCVPRLANLVGHGLAKLAVSFNKETVWIEYFSSCVENLVLNHIPG